MHIVREQKYNLPQADYEAMLKKQGHCCAVCCKSFDDETPQADHDHRCCAGETSCGNCIRSLICGNCNKALGLLNDNADRAMAMAAYLISFEDVLGKII